MEKLNFASALALGGVLVAGNPVSAQSSEARDFYNLLMADSEGATTRSCITYMEGTRFRITTVREQDGDTGLGIRVTERSLFEPDLIYLDRDADGTADMVYKLGLGEIELQNPGEHNETFLGYVEQLSNHFRKNPEKFKVTKGKVRHIDRLFIDRDARNLYNFVMNNPSYKAISLEGGADISVDEHTARLEARVDLKAVGTKIEDKDVTLITAGGVAFEADGTKISIPEARVLGFVSRDKKGNELSIFDKFADGTPEYVLLNDKEIRMTGAHRYLYERRLDQFYELRKSDQRKIRDRSSKIKKELFELLGFSEK